MSLTSFAATTHTLVKGDTLYSLSRKYGVSVPELQKANPKLNPASLKIGQTIIITSAQPSPASTPLPTPTPSLASTAAPIPSPSPSVSSSLNLTPTPSPTLIVTSIPQTPEFHIVSQGETLTRIAARYHLTLDELRNLNGLKNSNLRINQQLRLRADDSMKADTPAPKPTTTLPTPVPVGLPTSLPSPTPSPLPTATPKPSSAPAQRYIFVTPVKKLIDTIPKTTRKWKYIVIHHSGTSMGNAKIFEYYHRRVRGMENGMAYHFVIGNGSESKNGEIEIGNRWKKQLQGGHLRSDEQNEIAIGICLVGDFNKTRPNKKQIAALIELITYLRQKQYPQELRFVVHRDINIRPTDCPGRFFPAQAMYKLFGNDK